MRGVKYYMRILILSMFIRTQNFLNRFLDKKKKRNTYTFRFSVSHSDFKIIKEVKYEGLPMANVKFLPSEIGYTASHPKEIKLFLNNANNIYRYHILDIKFHWHERSKNLLEIDVQ
jgi:hypothetical protein